MKPVRLMLVAALTVSFAAWADTAEVWKAKCKSCHGEDGKAQTTTGKKEKIDDMSVEKWQSKWTDEKIKGVIVDGIKDTKMKPFKEKLTDEEIAGLVKHIRGFKK